MLQTVAHHAGASARYLPVKRWMHGGLVEAAKRLLKGGLVGALQKRFIQPGAPRRGYRTETGAQHWQVSKLRRREDTRFTVGPKEWSGRQMRTGVRLHGRADGEKPWRKSVSAF